MKTTLTHIERARLLEILHKAQMLYAEQAALMAHQRRPGAADLCSKWAVIAADLRERIGSGKAGI